ncbi:hypothetical protein QCA50_013745 [Cerrena zonata]|uniref:Uncharacterized protein n=1 Tax=Cerrena zonata TaxID=2478898 RepID=A0AAW0FUT7_9APHY
MILNIFFADERKFTDLQVNEYLDKMGLRDVLASHLRVAGSDIEELIIVPPGVIPLDKDLDHLHEAIQIASPQESLGLTSLNYVFDMPSSSDLHLVVRSRSTSETTINICRLDNDTCFSVRVPYDSKVKALVPADTNIKDVTFYAARMSWDYSDTPPEEVRSLDRNSLPKIMPETPLKQIHPWGFVQTQLHFFMYVSATDHQRQHSIPGHYARRQETVEALYKQVKFGGNRLVQVQGPPGCGKTTLKMMLEDYIRLAEPDTVVLCTNFWPSKEKGTTMSLRDRFSSSMEPGLFRDTSFHTQTQIRNLNFEGIAPQPTWVLMDEAQETYWDVELWTDFRNPRGQQVYFVLFAAYGTTWSEDTHLSDPMYIAEDSRVSLEPTKLVDHCLRFTRQEFEEFIINRQAAASFPEIDSDLRSWMYDLSGGHVGSLDVIARLIEEVSKSRKDQEPTIAIAPLSLAKFYDHFADPSDIFKKLIGESFRRGLPLDQHLLTISPGTVEFFRHILQADDFLFVIVEQPYIDIAKKLHMRGWIVLEICETQLVAGFASPLHRAWMSFYLDPRPIDSKFTAKGLLDFVNMVIRKLFPHFLEARSYQLGTLPWKHEFYRAACTLTSGRGIYLSPELCINPDSDEPDRLGQMDFHLRDKKWGIKILNGDARGDNDIGTEHLERFPDTSNQWVVNGTIQDHVILDFRTEKTTQPRMMDALPGAKNFYRVLLGERYTHYNIYDYNSTMIYAGLIRSR